MRERFDVVDDVLRKYDGGSDYKSVAHLA